MLYFAWAHKQLHLTSKNIKALEIMVYGKGNMNLATKNNVSL